MLKKIAKLQHLNKIQYLFLFQFALADGFNLSLIRHTTCIGWLCDVTAKEISQYQTADHIKMSVHKINARFIEHFNTSTKLDNWVTRGPSSG